VVKVNLAYAYTYLPIIIIIIPLNFHTFLNILFSCYASPIFSHQVLFTIEAYCGEKEVRIWGEGGSGGSWCTFRIFM